MTSILDASPYPWDVPAAQDLHTKLSEIYSTPQSARLVAEQTGLAAGAINTGQAPLDIWHDILSQTAPAGQTRKLVQRAHNNLKPESPVCPFLAALLANHAGMFDPPRRTSLPVMGETGSRQVLSAVIVMLAILAGLVAIWWFGFAAHTTTSSNSHTGPKDCSPRGLATLLSADALRPAVIHSDEKNSERLRRIMRDGMKWAVADFTPDQHHQCLVALSDTFEPDCPSFSMDISIRSENKLELRDVSAFLVKEDGSFRKMGVKLPENRNNTGILKIDQPKAAESLLLILRVGTERNDLDLHRTSPGYYMLTLTKK